MNLIYYNLWHMTGILSFANEVAWNTDQSDATAHFAALKDTWNQLSMLIIILQYNVHILCFDP